MNDLFTSMEEAREERLAIMHESSVPNAEAAANDDLFGCEVKAVMRRCYPRGEEAAEYFKLVEQKRGKESADRLRDAVRAEWKKRRIEEAGQA